MEQTHDLQRFVDAQDPVYAEVVAELSAGLKTSHWMWFVFPQLKALGRSSTAQHFGIESLAHAQAYYQHAVLGRRLRECCQLVLAIENRTAREIFGTPDDLKLRSCLTLFAHAAPDDADLSRALDRFFQGIPDSKTFELLRLG